MLYEGLTGRLPHLASNYNEMIVAKVVSDPEPLAHLRPDLPQELSDVVMRALAKEADARFESVDALREALAPFKDFEEEGEGEVIRISQTASAPMPTSAKRAVAEALAADDTHEDTAPPFEEEARSELTETRAESGRPKWVAPAAAAVLALTVVAGVVVGLAMSGGDPPADAAPSGVIAGAPIEPAPTTPVPSPEVTSEPEPVLTPVRFTTSPDGAVLTIDGEVACDGTPCTVELGDTPVRAVLERRGFRRETLELEPPFGETVPVELTRIRNRPTMRRSSDMTSPTPMMGGGAPYDMM